MPLQKNKHSFDLIEKVKNAKGVIFDAELLSIIDKADAGDYDSLRVLTESFYRGKKLGLYRKFYSELAVMPNLDLARYFGKIVLDKYEGAEIHQPELYLHDLKIIGMIESEAGCFEKSKEYFLKGVHYMTTKLPVEQWDYQYFFFILYSLYHFGIISEEEFHSRREYSI